MKTTARVSCLLLTAIGCLVAGCESLHTVRDSVRERFVGVPPHMRTMPGDEKQVFAAARLAMTKLGYDFERGGPAQGELEGFSHIGTGEDFHSSVQRSITIHLLPGAVGYTEVQVWMKEIVESGFDRSTSPATETPLRDPAAFDAFFEVMQQQLQGAAGK